MNHCTTAAFCRLELPSVTEYHQIATGLTAHSAQQRIVKFVYDRESNLIYFFDPSLYEYHFLFASQFLKIRESEAAFAKNYSGSGADRRYNLGSLIWDPTSAKPEHLLVELWSGDSIEAPYLKELISTLNDKIQIPFLFHPSSSSQEVAAEQAAIEYISTEALYRGKKYFILNPGIAYGYLRFLNAESEQNTCVDHTVITVYEKVPNEIGLVAGVLTAEYQTPLSHVNVKSINRGTVNGVLKNAFENLAEFENRPVALELAPDKPSPEIRVLTPAEEQSLILEKETPPNSLRPLSVTAPDWENKFAKLSELFGNHGIDKSEHSRWSQIIGAKATNLGVLNHTFSQSIRQVLGVEIPDGYGVSFAYYDRFLDQKQDHLPCFSPSTSGVEPTCSATLCPDNLRDYISEAFCRNDLLSETALHSACVASPILQDIREQITRSKIPDADLEQYKEIFVSDATSPVHQSKVVRIRLRSSTNSEDLEGFTGAGLYDSQGINLVKRYKKKDWPKRGYKQNAPREWQKIKKDLAAVIPSLYASVWNERAYAEREWFGLRGRKHMDVKVGIAIHRGFPAYELESALGEAANGVAISANVYNKKEDYKVYLNGQHFDLSITNPPSTADLMERKLTLLHDEYRTEELLVTTFLPDPEDDAQPGSWKYWSFEKIQSSSVEPIQSVVQPGRIEPQRLAAAVYLVENAFSGIYGKDASQFPVDVEWKVVGDNRTIWLKQARPFSTYTSTDDGAGILPPGFIVPPADRRQLPDGITRGPARPERNTADRLIGPRRESAL